MSGGQRQGVAVARAAAFGSRVVIMDEPTAALGVKESRRVLELILDVKKRGLPIILISHNMPHVFEVADRIHIHRLGRRLTVVDPKKVTMSDAVAMMTGAHGAADQDAPRRAQRRSVGGRSRALRLRHGRALADYELVTPRSPDRPASGDIPPHALSPARPHRPVRLGNLPRHDDLRRRRRVLAGDRHGSTRPQSTALVGRALEAGVNFIDTANVYSEGQSEMQLGQALRDLGVQREDVIVATKVRGRMGPGPNAVGLSRGHIIDQVAASLKRLGLDHIDLYQIHGFDPVTPIEETLRALDDLRVSAAWCARSAARTWPPGRS